MGGDSLQKRMGTENPRHHCIRCKLSVITSRITDLLDFVKIPCQNSPDNLGHLGLFSTRPTGVSKSFLPQTPCRRHFSIRGLAGFEG